MGYYPTAGSSNATYKTGTAVKGTTNVNATPWASSSYQSGMTTPNNTLKLNNGNTSSAKSASYDINTSPWSSAVANTNSSAKAVSEAKALSSSGSYSGGGISSSSSGSSSGSSITSGNEVSNIASEIANTGYVSQNAAMTLEDWQEIIEQSHAYDVESREWSAAEAAKQRDYETEMSNTSYQRAVKDLIAAGLNPVLAAKIGGASTPVGSSASGDYNNTSSMLSGIVSSAVSASIAETNRQNVLDQITSSEKISSNQLSNSKELAYISGYFGVQQSQITSGGIISSAQISAAATQYASNNALHSSLNSAEKQLEGSKYSSDTSWNRDVLSKSIDIYCKENYPSSVSGIASSLGQKLLGSTIGSTDSTIALAKIIGKLDSMYK